DQHDVTLLRRAIHRVELRETLSEPVELALDGLLGHLRLLPPDLEALVLAELGPRPHRHLDREAQLLALLREVGEVELGVSHRIHPRLDHRALVPVPERGLQGLREDRLPPEPLDHHLGWHLALAEAGQLHVLPELARRLVDAALDVLRIHVHLDADARVGKLLYGRLHGHVHLRARQARAARRLALYGRPRAPGVVLHRPRALPRRARDLCGAPGPGKGQLEPSVLIRSSSRAPWPAAAARAARASLSGTPRDSARSSRRWRS